MDRPGTASTWNLNGVSAGDVHAYLDKILASKSFRQSQRLSAFLEHVVKRTLEGRSEEISEYAIALDVFERDESFDSRIDSIVRVSALQLRKKLALYYDNEGNSDSIKIHLPTPGYWGSWMRYPSSPMSLPFPGRMIQV